MIAYKLVRQRKDGSLGPLFINARLRLPFNEWLNAELLPKKGYKPRKGWHCTAKPLAPHLSLKDRVWVKVEIAEYEELKRPKHQGGLWYLAQKMKVLHIL
jgi:hypothetical protein